LMGEAMARAATTVVSVPVWFPGGRAVAPVPLKAPAGALPRRPEPAPDGRWSAGRPSIKGLVAR